MLRCRTLGALELSSSKVREHTSVLSQPKRVALLVYLAVGNSRGFHRRDSLLALFWPELDAEHARAALRQALTFLRHELGDDVIRTRGAEEVGVDSERFWCDVVAFDDALRVGNLERALELYQGSFLAGFHVSGCGEFERWLEERRDELRDRAAGAAARLVERAEQAGSLAEAARWARRVLTLRPDDEPTLQKLIALLERTGDRSAALREYDAFAKRTRAEYQTEPSAQTMALIEGLRAVEPESIRGAPWSISPVAARPTSRQVQDIQVPEGQTDRKVRRRVTFVTGAAIGAALVIAVLGSWPLVRGNRGATQTAGAASHRQITHSGQVSHAALSPDGKYLAYVDGHERVSVQSVAGGEPRTLLTMPDIIFAEWSPDGSELALVQLNPNRFLSFRIPLLGGEPRPLGGGAIRRWLADGRRLAAFHGATDFWLRDLITGDRQLVPRADTAAWLEDADFERGGRWLAYITQPLNSARAPWTLWISRADGGEPRPLLEDTIHIGSLRWSPDGLALYYLRAAGPTHELRKLRISPRNGAPDGDPVVLLSGLEPAWVSPIAWAPNFTISEDGTKLAYLRTVTHSNLLLYPLEGLRPQEAGKRRLTTGTSLKRNPKISPDGAWVAFSDGDRSTRNVFTMAMQGGPIRQITFGSAWDDIPVWSPDGKTLAFVSNRDGRRRVWTVSAEGGIVQPFPASEVTSDPAGAGLAWAPGPDILYRRPGNRNWHVIDPITGGERALLHNDSLGWVFRATYSPDGNRVAVSWIRNQQPATTSGVWLLSLRDSSQVQLLAARWVPMGWTPGRRSLWVIDGDKWDVVHTLPVSGGEPRPMWRIPSDCGDHSLFDLSADGRHVVCVVNQSLRDAWMIENFDRDVSR